MKTDAMLRSASVAHFLYQHCNFICVP